MISETLKCLVERLVPPLNLLRSFQNLESYEHILTILLDNVTPSSGRQPLYYVKPKESFNSCCMIL